MPLPRSVHVIAPAIALLLSLVQFPRAPSARAAIPSARDGPAVALADSLARDAERYVRAGRPREAEEPARRALRLAEAARETTLTLRALRWLAVAIGNQGRGAEMAETWERALAIAKRSGHLGSQGFAHLGIGYHALYLGRAAAALAEFRSARAAFERAGDPVWAAWALLGMGQAYDRARDYERSRDCYRRIVAGADPKRNPGLVASASNNLAVLEYLLGDPAAAAEAFRAAYATERDSALLADRVTEGTNLAICEAELGRFDDAAALLDTLLRVSREHGYGANETKVLLERGDLLRRRGWLNESARSLREAFDRSAGGLLKDHVESAAGLARTLADADSLRAAERVVADLVRRASAWPAFPHQAELDLLGGEMLVRAGRPAEALPLLARAERGAAARGLERDRVSALAWLGRAWRASGRRDSALATLTRGRELWERARGVMRDLEWREVYGGQSRALHGALIELALEGAGPEPATDRAAAAFDVLQQYKARTLRERMLGPWSPADAPAEGAASRAAITARELQHGVLRPGEIYLEVFTGADTTLLFAVTRESLRVAGLPPGLPARIARWRQALATPPGRGEGAARRAALERSARRLGDEVLAPFAHLLRDRASLVFCPDGELNLVPFTLLVAARGGEASGGRAAPTVTHVPSATVFARLRRAAVPATGVARGVLVVAPGRRGAGPRASGAATRLPGAEREARWLAAHFADVESREGAAGARALEPRDLARYEVLHFATHALADDQHPWRSGVRVGADPPADPYLRAAQLAATPLAASLAVVAGCESAGGRVLSGEGVQGLTAAFLGAGVPAVVASLWPVDDDATARLMREFYGRLARGRTVASALAEAQAALRERRATADPFFWAGFVVVGDPDVTPALRSRASWRGPALAACAFALAGLLAWAMGRRRARAAKDSA